MDGLRNFCTPALILASLVVLAVNYQFISFGEIAANVGPLSLSKITISENLPAVVSVAVLLGLLLCHVTRQWLALAERFSRGYRESPRFVELVRNAVATAAGTGRFGSPFGGLACSFRRRSFGLGQFTSPNETLSAPVIVLPDWGTHWRAVLLGVLRTVNWKLLVNVYVPVFLAVWAFASMVA